MAGTRQARAAAATPGDPAPAARRRARNSLNQDVIVTAAFAVTDRDGIAALTFDALGRELGAHPTAIYRHFRDKDELLLAMTDALHAHAQLDGLPVTDDWADDLRAIARAIHRAFLAHPQTGQLVAARTARRHHEFAAVEHISGCMRRAGLPPREAARCYRVFADMVLAYSSMDAALAALAPAVRDGDLRAWDVEYRLLPAEDYPNVAALVDHIPALDDDANFELAVELMIESIRARSAASGRSLG